MKLDIFPHIFPRSYFDKMVEVAPDRGAIKRWLNIPVLYDLEARLEMMEEFGDYQQILTLSLPAIEFVAGPEKSPELARIANDGMAEICARRPDRFPGFVASPVISPVAALPGFFVATGFSGHGFGIGPAAGKLMADLVSGETPLVDPAPFRFERFTDGSNPRPFAGAT